MLATCCFLYERYAKAYLKDAGKKASSKNVLVRCAVDFGIRCDVAKAFWNVIRNGLLHGGMPKARDSRGRTSLPAWRMHGSFETAINLMPRDGMAELQIQPWLLRDQVLKLYRARPDLIAYDGDFPWGAIVKLVEE